MSGLVAVDAEDFDHSVAGDLASGDYANVVQFSPGADEAVNAAQAFAEGDWASGVINLAGAGAELVSTYIDPIGALASSAAGFLLDYMPPLPQMLDALAGNPSLVESIGDTWVNISTAIENAARDLDQALATLLSSWTGLAAQAYAAVASGMVDTLNKLAFAYQCIGQGIQLASGIVEAVRSITKEIISELVGSLISWAVQVTATAGIGASWVIPQATARIADTVTDATKLADALTEAMRFGTDMVANVTRVIGYVSDFLGSIDNGVEQGSQAGDSTE